MEKSFVFNSINGDRRYKAEDFREYFASFIGNGVFPNPSTNLQVLANNNMTITIKAGKSWINGAIYINTSDYIVSIEPADGVLNRRDRIVLRMDTAERKIYAYAKKGTFASSAVSPTLQRDADAYEIALADVKVSKGVVSITQADITDLRQNKELCGIVHGAVEQIDVTTLFNQYSSKLEQKEVDFEEDFKKWFETVKGQLSGDVAGNLANQIAQNSDKIQSVESQMADMTKEIENIDLSANKVKLNKVSGMNATEVQTAIQELFQFADNGKKNISTVIGSPLTTSDTFDSMKSKIQTLKNTFATNLTSKEQSSSGSESLESLINKVKNINPQKKWVKGDFKGSESGSSRSVYLKWKPGVIIVNSEDPYNSNYTSCTIVAWRPDSESYARSYSSMGANLLADISIVSDTEFKVNSLRNEFAYRWLAIEL